MSENEHDHGSYVRKVLDGGRRYTQELLEKNSDLRVAVAELQVREQGQPIVTPIHPGPRSAPSTGRRQLQHLMQQLADAAAQAKELRGRLYDAEQEARRLR
jgi:hypothetical protein